MERIVVQTIVSFIGIYLILLFIRVILSWFPNINWYSQPFAALSQVTDPYLNVFRSVIPPLGGIDFSPMLGFLVLQLLLSTLQRFSYSFG